MGYVLYCDQFAASQMESLWQSPNRDAYAGAGHVPCSFDGSGSMERIFPLKDGSREQQVRQTELLQTFWRLSDLVYARRVAERPSYLDGFSQSIAHGREAANATGTFVMAGGQTLTFGVSRIVGLLR